MNNFFNIAHNLVLTNNLQALRTTPIAGLLVQERNVNAFHLAGASENVDAIILIAERFRENGIPINIPDGNGNTILHHVGAFLQNNATLIHTLLGMLINLYGANILLQNNAGDTALHNAVYYSNQTVALYLIHSHILAPIETGMESRNHHLLIRNNNGYNPLQAAVNTLEDLEDVNDRTSIRNMIIHFLMEMNAQELNQLTINNNPQTALDIANELDTTDLINADVRIRLLNEQARGVSPATARRSPTAHMNYIDDDL